MTKEELIDAILDWRDDANSDYEYDSTFEDLQNLNFEYGDKQKYKDRQSCLTAIIKKGNKKAIEKAINFYENYIATVAISAAIDEFVNQIRIEKE